MCTLSVFQCWECETCTKTYYNNQSLSTFSMLHCFRHRRLIVCQRGTEVLMQYCGDPITIKRTVLKSSYVCMCCLHELIISYLLGTISFFESALAAACRNVAHLLWILTTADFIDTFTERLKRLVYRNLATRPRHVRGQRGQQWLKDSEHFCRGQGGPASVLVPMLSGEGTSSGFWL